MRKLLTLTVVALSTWGCQATTTNSPRLLIRPEQAKKIGLKLTGSIAGDQAGFVYLATPTNLMRYDPKLNQIEPMLVDPALDLTGVSGTTEGVMLRQLEEKLVGPHKYISDVAVTPDGVVLVLRPQELDAYVAGHLVKVHSVPAPALMASCDREFAYILVATEKGAKLLRYHLTGGVKGTMDTILTTQDCPRALWAVPGGCLVASGGNIVKVTDPVQAPGETGPHISTVLLVALGEDVTSMAVDPGRSYVYFATEDATFVWAQGQILPVFPAGSRLVWVDDTLTICQPSVGQLVQIGSVSGHVQKLLAGGPKAGSSKR
jgi:hypothetical protein